MRVIDRNTAQKPASKPALPGPVQKIIANLGGQGDEPAKKSLIAALERSLDNQYLMLGPVKLERLDEPLPLVLLGPTGVWVIDASSLKGIYQVKEDTWEKLESQSHHFKTARPNLPARILAMSQALHAHLTANGYTIPEIEPVLYFSDPGMHVNAVRLVVRIVLSDAVDRFVAGIQQGYPVHTVEVVQRMANLLIGETQQLPDEKPLERKDDFFSFHDELAKPAERPVRKVVVQKKRAAGKAPFSPRQWIFLSAMVLVNLVILVAFVVFILSTN